MSHSDSAQWKQWVSSILTGVDLVHWLLGEGPEAALSDSVEDAAKADVCTPRNRVYQSQCQ